MLFNLFRFSLFKATVLALPTFPIFLTLISGYYARGVFFCESDVYDSFKVIGLSESALTKQGLYLLSIIPAQLVVRQITFIPGVHNGLLIAGVLQTHSVSK